MTSRYYSMLNSFGCGFFNAHPSFFSPSRRPLLLPLVQPFRSGEKHGLKGKALSDGQRPRGTPTGCRGGCLLRSLLLVACVKRVAFLFSYATPGSARAVTAAGLCRVTESANALSLETGL